MSTLTIPAEVLENRRRSLESLRERFHNREWARNEIEPLFNKPDDKYLEAHKAWEGLRYLYLTGRFSELFAGIVDYTRSAEMQELLGPSHSGKWHLPCLSLIRTGEFPETPWTKLTSVYKRIYAEHFHENGGLVNLRAISLVSPREKGLFEWVADAQAYLARANSISEMVRLLWQNPEELVLRRGAICRAVLDIDLSMDDAALAGAFEELAIKLRGRKQRAKSGQKNLGQPFFKGLILHYRVGLGDTHKVAAEGVYGKPGQRWNRAAHDAHEMVKTFLAHLQQALAGEEDQIPPNESVS